MNTTSSFPDAYWSIEPDTLMSALQTSTAGLSQAEAARHLEQYGPNTLKAKQRSSALLMFISQFKSPIMLILLFATLISGIVKDWIDALIILLIVVGSATLSFLQEYGANNAAEKLRSQISSRVTLLRDGHAQSVPIEQVAPGDIATLSAGSLVPGDGIVLEARDFFVNQAILTGETFPVEKYPSVLRQGTSLAERTNSVFMGTSVRSGSATVLIIHTGAQTAFGQIAKRLSLRPPETEFERGIRHLGYLLTEVMLLLVFGIFAVNVAFHKPFLDSLLFSIALAVGLTPQLLPAIININLSKGSQKMAGKGVIVRRLESIENFGSMDVLCTDKTGTLTLGVVQLDAAFDVKGGASPSVFRYAYLNAVYQTGLANPMDEAILAKEALDVSNTAKVDEIPYDFVRKRLSVIVKDSDQLVLVTKGALENVLEVCSQFELNGQVFLCDEVVCQEFHKLFVGWSEEGYRVLGVAHKPVEPASEAYTKEAEGDMCFDGFLLFFDPPKKEVRDVVTNLAKCGVQLKVITGDNHLVAVHTAQDVGIENPKVMTSVELDNLRDEALWHAAECTDIFAEVDPNQKERIILALKKMGHVVGYMGDGINDAPSLHSADVGISVDTAVDVAKEAADFVLLKQDLGVLFDGIIEGRKTFANTLKYVFMATSANFGNMFSVAGASLFLPFLPMLPKQILLINFMTDLPEMTIAGDNVDEAFTQRPHRWNMSFIRRFMLVFGPLSSFFDFLTFGVLLWVMKAGPEVFHTGWFLESVLSATLVVFVLRTRLPIGRSRPSRAMLLATGLVGLAALALPYSPLATLLSFRPLPVTYLAILAVITALYFISAEVTKRWFYRRYGNLLQ
jgi:P-type Mg2+ transporter